MNIEGKEKVMLADDLLAGQKYMEQKLQEMLNELVKQKPKTKGGGMLPIHHEIESIKKVIKLVNLNKKR